MIHRNGKTGSYIENHRDEHRTCLKGSVVRHLQRRCAKAVCIVLVDDASVGRESYYHAVVHDGDKVVEIQPKRLNLISDVKGVCGDELSVARVCDCAVCFC